MGHYVYKYILHQEVIYIGKNNTDLVSRLNQHGRIGDNITKEGWDEINSAEIYYCKLANKIMSDVVESELIRRYKPKYNRAKKSKWDGLPFEEPEWTQFTTLENFKKKEREEKVREKIKIEKNIKEIELIKNRIKFLKYKKKELNFVLKYSYNIRNYEDIYIEYDEVISNDIIKKLLENRKILMFAIDKSENELLLSIKMDNNKKWDKKTILIEYRDYNNNLSVKECDIRKFKSSKFKLMLLFKLNKSDNEYQIELNKINDELNYLQEVC